MMFHSLWRKIVGIVLAAIIMMGVNGCMEHNNIEKISEEMQQSSERSTRQAEKIRDEMLQYMNAKYGKEFLAVSLDQRGIDNSKDVFKCYAKGENPDTDYASVYRMGTGNNISYSDTYFGVIVRDDVETEISSICRELSLDSKAFFSFARYCYDSIYDSTKTYADFLEDEDRPGIAVKVGVAFEQDGDAESISEQIFQIMEDRGFRGYLNIHFITKEAFDNLSWENSDKILSPLGDHILARYAKSIY
jgi:hypothetical protein